MEKEEKNNGKYTVKINGVWAFFLVGVLMLGTFGVGLYVGREKAREIFEQEEVSETDEAYQAKLREVEDWLDIQEVINENINEYGIELLEEEMNIKIDRFRTHIDSHSVDIEITFRYTLTEVSTSHYKEIQRFIDTLIEMGRNADRGDIDLLTYSSFDPEEARMITKHEFCYCYYIDSSDINS